MENLTKRPSKGILKTATSIEQPDSKLTRQNSHDKDIKWDEMNILQTLHPPDKDYGHMKIEEPKTPFSYYTDNDVEVNSDNETNAEIDPENLAALISKKAESPFGFGDDEMYKSMDDEELGELTEEERERRKDFESKRKKHYNEYQMVKLARKLLKDEMEEEEEEDDGTKNGPSSAPSTSTNDAKDGVRNVPQPDKVEDISQT